MAVLLAREPGRRLVVCREISKLHEQISSGTVAQLAPEFAGGARGEVTLVLAPGERREGAVDLRPALRLLSAEGVGARTAAKVIAALGVAPRNSAYQAALDLAEGAQEGP